METQVARQIREFLAKHIANHDLKPDEDIFSLGYVNSLFAMQLVSFVEQTFDLTVENEDLEIDNFRSIDAITGFVLRKKETAGLQ